MNNLKLTKTDAKEYQSIFERVNANIHGNTYGASSKKTNSFLKKHKLGFGISDIKHLGMISELMEATIILTDGTKIKIDFAN